MTEEKYPEPPKGGPKKLVLKLRDRLPISTSQGTLFVRHLVTSDLPSFSAYADHATEPQSQDYFALGETALKTFTCLEAKSEKPPPLSDEAYAALSADDINVLAKGIAEVGGLGPLPEGPVREALGTVLSNRLRFHAKQAAESAAEIKKTMDRSFGTISESAKASLADSLSGMAALRESLREAAQGPIHSFNFPVFRQQPVEDTPIGRAAIAGEESARHLREVAGLAGQMTEKFANLSEVMLTQVLPEWFKNLNDGSKATNTSLTQAQHSVNLAKQAIILSIVVTVLMTMWQLWVAREYKLENGAQQTSSEALLRQQLLASQALNSQLAENSMKLNEQLAKVSQALGNIPASKTPASQPGKHTPSRIEGLTR